MVDAKQARITVTGRVQGVFFRAFAKQQAGKLGLTGYAKNMPDGSLEIIAQGPEAKIEQLAKLCKMGPLMAKVESIDIAWGPIDENFEYFDIRY